MIRTILAALMLFGCVTMSTAGSNGQPRIALGDSVEAVLALARGDLAGYKKYVETELAWHEAQQAQKQFDLTPISNSIIEYAKRHNVTLTREDYERKLTEAEKLLQGVNSGWRRFHREKMKELYATLSLLCSLMSEPDCEAKNQQLALQKE